MSEKSETATADNVADAMWWTFHTKRNKPPLSVQTKRAG